MFLGGYYFLQLHFICYNYIGWVRGDSAARLRCSPRGTTRGKKNGNSNKKKFSFGYSINVTALLAVRAEVLVDFLFPSDADSVLSAEAIVRLDPLDVALYDAARMVLTGSALAPRRLLHSIWIGCRTDHQPGFYFSNDDVAFSAVRPAARATRLRGPGGAQAATDSECRVPSDGGGQWTGPDDRSVNSSKRVCASPSVLLAAAGVPLPGLTLSSPIGHPL